MPFLAVTILDSFADVVHVVVWAGEDQLVGGYLASVVALRAVMVIHVHSSI